MSATSLIRIFVFLSIILTGQFALNTDAGAQSSVRPPSNAVNQPSSSPAGPSNSLGSESQSDYWRDLRQGKSGPALLGKKGSQLIQSRGEDWRLVRINYILKYSSWILVSVVGILALFFLLRGKIRIKSGRSGKVMPRFTLNERVVHWFMACVFILLAISGLILLLGKIVLIPLVGKQAFGLIASAALQGHNLFGPLFVLAVIMLFFTFIRGNMLQMVDIKWLLKGGGFFGGHASSHRYNFGEKAWFWLATLVGFLMSITGIVLLMPGLIPELIYLQGATLLHGVGAIGLIAAALGHIYIGTIGMEGALESMTHGVVDENWAKEHHDLWYEAHVSASTEDVPAAEAKAARGDV